jgi:hypothetical protein
MAIDIISLSLFCCRELPFSTIEDPERKRENQDSCHQSCLDQFRRRCNQRNSQSFGGKREKQMKARVGMVVGVRREREKPLQRSHHLHLEKP